MSGKTTANKIIGGSEIGLGILLVPVSIPLAIATGATLLPIGIFAAGVITAIDGVSRVQGKEGIISELNATLGTHITDPVHTLRDKLAAYFDKGTKAETTPPEPDTQRCATTTTNTPQPEAPCVPAKPKSQQLTK